MANLGAVELPQLTGTNYHEWSLVMQVSLKALKQWNAMEAVSKDRGKDQRTLAMIIRIVPPKLKAMLAVKQQTAKEAWEAVKMMRVGEDRVKEASRQRLLKEFENLQFKDGELIDDFAVRVNTLIDGLWELGEEVKDGRMVRKVLRVVPKKWKQVAVSIEIYAPRPRHHVHGEAHRPVVRRGGRRCGRCQGEGGRHQGRRPTVSH